MSNEVGIGLSPNWLLPELAEVAVLIGGVSYKKQDATSTPSQGMVPILRATNISGSALTFDSLVYVPEKYVSKAQYLKKGDIVVASSSGSKEVVGKSGQVSNDHIEASFGAFCTLVRPEPEMDDGYLGLYFQSPGYRAAISTISAGSNINNIKRSELSVHRVPVPPKAEQARIAQKLEELLSDLDAGLTELKAAQRKLAQYRRSMLKAAVEGVLTADWRAARPRSGGPQETGADLLQRVLTERRACWEAKELAKYAEQGKPLPKVWQAKYPEPVVPDTTDSPQLPEGWVWASLDALLCAIETGKSFKCDERPPTAHEVGVVKVSAVSWGEYQEQESKTCTDEALVRPELFVRPGDFLFSRANTVALVGACVIAKTVSKNVMLSDKILRFKLAVPSLKEWLLIFLRSDLGRKQIETLASGNQESMRNIGQERIRQIVVPIPPEMEIFECLETLTNGIQGEQQFERAIDLTLASAVAQRKNILKSAFAGQLVPQNPNDEPASELLERIRAERSGTGRASPGKRSRKTKEHG